VADKSELQHIPRAVDALVLSEARSSLIARASDAGKTIMARKPDPALRAKVKMNGRWGLIDKNGRFAVEPFCCDIRDFSCGMAAFSDVPVQRSKRLYQRALDDLVGRQDRPLERPSEWGYHPGHWGFADFKWRAQRIHRNGVRSHLSFINPHATRRCKIAFWQCSRFSASSNMVDALASNVSSSISFPRYAGRQCITSAPGRASFTRPALI